MDGSRASKSATDRSSPSSSEKARYSVCMLSFALNFLGLKPYRDRSIAGS